MPETGVQSGQVLLGDQVVDVADGCPGDSAWGIFISAGFQKLMFEGMVERFFDREQRLVAGQKHTVLAIDLAHKAVDFIDQLLVVGAAPSRGNSNLDQFSLLFSLRIIGQKLVESLQSLGDSLDVVRAL